MFLKINTTKGKEEMKMVKKSNSKLEFEDTELRLGLASSGGEKTGKRGFGEIGTVDLKLNLAAKETTMGRNNDPPSDDLHNKPPPKAQVVGWPPVGSFRKSFMAAQKSGDCKEDEKRSTTTTTAFVKVSMDGAPYLRKVDLKIYKSYRGLSDALGEMFCSFTMGKCEAQGMMEPSNSCDYVTTYEDKDGDWMLVGDVPWEMFVESCKRLRIMKGTSDRKN